MKDRIIAHVDMDAFFVTVSLLSKPEWFNMPVVVAHGGEYSQIASANYAARKFGIQNGYATLTYPSYFP